MSLRGAVVLASSACLLLGFDAQAVGRQVPDASRTAWAHATRAMGTRAGSDAPPRTRVGAVRILTYNVAGLPWILTGERRRAVMPRIGELLNDFPLALVQEDFAWHEDLARFARHPYRSAPGSAGWALYADGLSTFSALPLREVARVAWNSCHGVFRANSDCLASKGFAVFEVALGQGVSVHVYNLHGDAGKRKGDRRSRTRGYGQLARHLQSASRERAVIVAGDTNLKDGDAEDRRTLARFLGATGLRDACRSLACGDERIDRVFFRGTSALALRPTEWRIERDFVDPAGRALSDHAAVSVRFAWTAHPARRPPEP